jgi:glycosidase
VRFPALTIFAVALGVHSLAADVPTPMTSPTRLTFSADALDIEFAAPDIEKPNRCLFVALETGHGTVAPRGVRGSAQMPFGQGEEGSGVFLPFRANRFYYARTTSATVVTTWREWKETKWSDRMDVKPEFSARTEPGKLTISVRLSALGKKLPNLLRVAVWAKDMGANSSWGWMLGDPALGIRPGMNDKYLDRCFAIDLTAKTVRVESRRGANEERVRIYQLLPRLFGNINETRKANGTLAENGVGKFADINDAALGSIKAMGFTHVWLTGVLSQATSTDYAALGLPADDPDLLKGLAGSPYAIKDCFDVCPDYAVEPRDRMGEFQALLARVHANGLRAIIDFVPNHVARSYWSTVKSEQSFGAQDDRRKFFDPQNNFFWLQPDSPGGGAPLRLPTVAANGEFLSPTCKVLGKGDGLFDGESDRGRVTGNNAATWSPGMNDWYETVKLNYGYDFTTKKREYPAADKSDRPVPNTWNKMDAVIAHWQAQGVDGFRCDMAHMVPPEFWAWALERARARQPGVFFVGEAYDNDPMKVGEGNVMIDLLSAGFNAVYDDPSYKSLKGMFDGGAWANDLDKALAAADREFIFQNALRYAENHDEVRIAGKGQWGGIGAAVGRPVSAILYGVARGPVLLYSGQETGEPADGVEGFGGDDARTTIFDYWSMPEVAKWVNGHRYDGGRLSAEQQDLREFYGRLMRLVGEPAFRDGDFYALNYANKDYLHFGRLPGENASGHWLYAFLRSDLASGQRFLVVVNLHRSETLRDVRVQLPPAALDFAGLGGDTRARLVERLATAGQLTRDVATLKDGVSVGDIPPLTPYYLEINPTNPTNP